jgi:lysophospholipase L1-like esterase
MSKLKDAGLVLLTAGLALAGAEVAARRVLPPLPHVEIQVDPEATRRRAGETAERRAFETESSEIAGLYVYTPTGLRLRASTVARIRQHDVSGRTVEIRTNALGYRNREIGPKERRRVLFLGDSITNGGYVDEAETFVRRVEALSAAGAPYETINAGVGGIGLEDELAILTETGLGTDPDVVVVDFYLNDALPSPAVWLLPPPSFLERSRLVAHLMLSIARLRDAGKTERAAAPADLEGWLAQVRRDFPAGPGDPQRDRGAFHLAIDKSFRDWGNAWSDGAWARMAPVIREFRRLSDIHGFELRFVAFPLRQQVEAEYVADEPQRRLAALCAELRVPCLDLLPALREAHRRGGPALYYDHCHPTPEGNEIVAREILAFLRRHEDPRAPGS